ncbi:DMT family transporter [Liquorilactobacillus uvarum]|uniref:DMT family transporter n=1 Tax=Liquorilactobacillus uvarum TaxID=303240 RepID=UPI00288A9F07|nr:DMT family transporter [Liquorilactobacillus uvarum]
MKLQKWQANIILLFTAMIWGASYIFIKQALRANMPAGVINSIRGFIFAILIYFFFHKKINKMTRADFKVGLIAGVINFIGYQLQATGLKYTTPSNSAFLTATYIVMIPFVVWVFFKKRPLLKSYFSISICFLGTVFLTNTISNGFSLEVGDILTLLSAFFYALQIVYFSNTVASANPFIVSFMLGSVQGVASLIWSLLFEQSSYGSINWSVAIIPVVILGVLASFGAQTMQVIGQKFTDSTSAGLILMTESLFGSILSVILGFDKLEGNLIVGGLLIVLSIFIMEFNVQRLFLKKRSFLRKR